MKYTLSYYEDRAKNTKGLFLTNGDKEYFGNPGESIKDFIASHGLKLEDVKILQEVTRIIYR